MTPTVPANVPRNRRRHCHTCGTVVGYLTGSQMNFVWHPIAECPHYHVKDHAHYYCPTCCPDDSRGPDFKPLRGAPVAKAIS